MSNPLLTRLAKLRRMSWMLAISSGFFAVLALLSLFLLAEGWFDWYTHVPSLVRGLLLLGLLAASGWLLFQLTLYPLARRTDNLSLALKVEETYPFLNDSLASTIQFLDYPEKDPVASSFQKVAIERTQIQTEGVDFLKVLRFGPLGLYLLLAVAGCAACYYMFRTQPQNSQTAFLRLADPFGNHTWTSIGVKQPKEIWPVGKPFSLQGEVQGIKPKTVRFELEVFDSNKKQYVPKVDKILKLVSKNNEQSWAFQLDKMDLENRGAEARVRYRIQGNDGQFPKARGSWQKMDVLYPPQLLSTPIEIHLPEYLGLPSPQPADRSLQIPLGTVVDYHAAASRRISPDSFLELRSGNNGLQSVLALGSLVGPGTFGSALTNIPVFQYTAGRFPVVPTENGTNFHLRFMPLAVGHGYYVLHLVDGKTSELTYTEKFDLVLADDPAPLVKLHHPASNQEYLPSAKIQFDIETWDDKYGLKTIFLEYQKKNAEGQEEGPVERRMLWDPRLAGVALRQMAGMPAPWELLAKVSPNQLRTSRTWPLDNQFKEGETLIVRACADDYCNIFSNRDPGRTDNVLEIRIVGEKEIAKNIDRKMEEINQDIVRLKKKQENAQELLQDIKPDKMDQKAFDQLLEGAEAEKAIKEAAGDLQKKLADAQKMLKENDWPNSEEKDLMRNIGNELERMVQQDFPKLEAQLNQVKKEAVQNKPDAKPEKKGDKNEKQEKGAFEKAQDTQKDIQKSLDELSQSVSKYADLSQKKMEIRELMTQQEKIAEETRKIQEKFEELKNKGDKTPQGKAEKQDLKDRLNHLANNQKKLGEETRKLLDKMDGLKDRLQDKGDMDSAKKVDEARKAGEKNSLPKKMTNDIPEKLKDENQLQKAMQDQNDANKGFKEMLAKLEGNREDQLDRLKKKEKQVKDAKNDLDKLIKKNQDINKLNDPQEKARELKQLAEEAREEAKELQRLGEQRAAKEMENAARMLEEAGKKAAMNEDPQEMQKEALDRMNNAKEDLEELEEHLAREQLAKIADRLVAIKERQDSAIERSKELHKKVVAKKSWSLALLKTLDAERKNQESLSKETGSLQEKLKDAIVFETILDLAAKNMQKASEAQKERKDIGKDRQYAAEGQVMEEEELKDESRRQDHILRLQGQASQRLQRLLDAVNEQPVAKKKRPQKKEGEPMKMEDDPDMAKGLKAQDGLPPMAELKAIKGEQEELLRRTKEFHDAHPNLMQLTEEERQEFDTIQTEQNRLRTLFDRMMEKTQKGVQ